MDVSEIRVKLSYCPESGDITRIESGRIIGGINSSGYVRICVSGKSYKAHRIAFVLMGIDPTGFDVDHINGNKSDNRWENLRLATRSENMQNLGRTFRHSISGIRGVSSYNGRWRSRIKKHGKIYHLGFFDNKNDAEDAYIKAKAKLHTFQSIHVRK